MQNRIKVLRAERDWTQADLAQKISISRQAVISIEKYKYPPSLELAFKIAKVFNVSINEVFKYKDGENKVYLIAPRISNNEIPSKLQCHFLFFTFISLLFSITLPPTSHYP